MLKTASLATALLLGLATIPALAEPAVGETGASAAAQRTLEQNRRVSIGPPPAASQPPPVESRAATPAPARRLASAR